MLPSPSPPPPPPQSGGACVPETDCSKNSLCNMDWTSYCSSLASANLCLGPYCRSGSSLLSSAAASGAGAVERHGALAADGLGPRLRPSSSRQSRAAANQVALIQRSVAVASQEEAPEKDKDGSSGQDELASGLSLRTAEL